MRSQGHQVVRQHLSLPATSIQAGHVARGQKGGGCLGVSLETARF